MVFHPIAYDNIKYLLEGHIYDLDLDNELVIIDRNDWINQAKWNKSYDITYELKNHKAISCTLYLHASLKNITSELVESNKNEMLSGATFRIEYNINKNLDQNKIESVLQIVRNVWGDNRIFEVVQSTYLPKNTSLVKLVVSFERLIYEEQMEDLEDLVKESLQTLKKISLVG